MRPLQQIVDRPANGEFVAPLLPFFIEDYRSAVEGPYGQGFATTNNRPNWLYDNVCNAPENAGKPDNERIALDWVYAPQFVHVTDDGTNYMIDTYWRCSSKVNFCASPIMPRIVMP